MPVCCVVASLCIGACSCIGTAVACEKCASASFEQRVLNQQGGPQRQTLDDVLAEEERRFASLHGFSIARNQTAEQRRRRIELVSSFAKKKKCLGSHKKIKGDEYNCTICLEGYDPKKRDCVAFEKCKHYFHKECINEWLLDHNKCPLCNNKVN